jgi:hypothetical protein
MPKMPGLNLPKGYDMYSLPTMGGDQKSIYDLISGHFKEGAGDIYEKIFGLAGGNSDMFAQLEAPAIRQFNEQIAPGIANRYAGSGIGGSSGMQNSLSAAGSNLAENLQSQRTGLMERSIQSVLGLGDRLMSQPTQQFGLVQKQNILNQIMQLLGGVGGNIAGIYGGSKLAGL